MDLFEYQARDLFERYGIPVPNAAVARSVDEAVAAAENIGLPVVIKAQVKTGGRGKAGGVKLAKTMDEVRAATSAILGMTIKGHVARAVLVAPGVDIAQEYYLSILLDRARRGYVAIATASGGMEIEELAESRPEALTYRPLHPANGIGHEGAVQLVADAAFPIEVRDQLVDVVERLWEVCAGEDALLVEINPLVRTGADEIIALDGKVTLDDNAAFRHPDHAGLADIASTDPLEVLANERGLNYVKLDGQVGIIGNGAGLVMSTLDVVARAGQELGGITPANFLDIGGGASADVMADGLGLILSDPDVRAVFVNVFGGITACDAVADGIVAALDRLGDEATKPIVVRLDGNNVVAGRSILQRYDHPRVTVVDTMDQAAAAAARLAQDAMSDRRRPIAQGV